MFCNHWPAATFSWREEAIDCRFGNLDTYVFKFREIHLAIWTNIFANIDKYILLLLAAAIFSWREEAIDCQCCNLDTYVFKFREIHLGIWPNTFGNIDKYILQLLGGGHFQLASGGYRLPVLKFGQLCFEIQRNTFGNSDKYILLRWGAVIFSWREEVIDCRFSNLDNYVLKFRYIH